MLPYFQFHFRKKNQLKCLIFETYILIKYIPMKMNKKNENEKKFSYRNSSVTIS